MKPILHWKKSKAEAIGGADFYVTLIWVNEDQLNQAQYEEHPGKSLGGLWVRRRSYPA
jgi:hypothetical protein